MPSKANIDGPYRTRDFEIYKLWRIITLRTEGDLREISPRLKNNRELQLELKRIKTQAEFARKFGIKDPGTLSDWNLRIGEPRKFLDKDLRGTELGRLVRSLEYQKRRAQKPKAPPHEPLIVPPQEPPRKTYETITDVARERGDQDQQYWG